MLHPVDRNHTLTRRSGQSAISPPKLAGRRCNTAPAIFFKTHNATHRN